MLAEARRSLAIPLIRGRAEALPVADASFDFVSMGYALRHVPDLAVAFAEIGVCCGRADACCCWRSAVPMAGPPMRQPGSTWNTVVPALSRWLGGGRRASR